jgi:PleD family two-component response regulator
VRVPPGAILDRSFGAIVSAQRITQGGRMAFGKVLVVDDEVPLARIIGSYLEREGFDVTVAH